MAKKINSSVALLKIYQAIKGSQKDVFDPVKTLQDLGNRQSIILKIYSLKRVHWLVYKPDIFRCQLTKEGYDRALKEFVKYSVSQKKWDGSWWFLIFDIPEEYKYYRESLRKTLIELGCRKVQLSVWVAPVDILHELKLLLPSFRVGDWVQVIKSKEVSNYRVLIKRFDLGGRGR